MSLRSYDLLSHEQLAMSDTATRYMVCAAIALLALLHPRVMGAEHVRASGTAVTNILKVVYELTTVDDFCDRCNWLMYGMDGLSLPDWLAKVRIDAEAIVDALSTVPHSIHPPRQPRPVHLSEKDGLLIDWYSMTRLFVEAMERIGFGGDSANIYGAVFEERIQDWINQSRWCPPPELVELRRRTLRRGGRQLTDIDAIGACDGKLLLVSCKSRPLSDAYERGEYDEVRNARTKAEQAVASLGAVVNDLQQNPVGDNYDLSGFQEIVGVVVYPFLPYVGLALLRAESLPGLHILVSDAELLRYLGVSFRQ